MIKKNTFRDNVLLQYTLISLSLTLTLAIILSWNTSRQLKEQLIISHGDFYRAYIEAIDENYTELIPYIIGGSEVTEENHEAESHPDSQKSSLNHSGDDNLVWSHFKSDLLQFPFVEEVRILNYDGEMLWTYISDHFDEEIDPLMDEIKSATNINEIISYVTDDDFIVVYSLPILRGDTKIGTVQITDFDPSLKLRINRIQRKAVLQIFLGGFVFYLSLFILYYKVHRNREQTIENLDKSQTLTIDTMSRLAELRDDNTGAHIKRTSLYCKILGMELSRDKQFSSYLTSDYIRDLERSAPLHDIGKVGVPDSILQKPGPLTEEEFKIIQTHPELGAKVLQQASSTLGFQSFFEIGYQIVLHHHENWDGSGYPYGLSGENIPLSARIMSVVDVFDALTTERPYKKAFTHEKTINIIKEESGKKFDPRVVNAFLSIPDQFYEIARMYNDLPEKTT